MHETEATLDTSLVHFFAPGDVEGDPQRKDILGGKGASLAAMTKAGLPVPPGFTIGVPCCGHYHEHGKRWPRGLTEEIRRNIEKLEQVTGQSFGSGSNPLLVSVRSGAASSMPGMMDTILNCGLHPGLEAHVPNAEHFWRVYAQFIRQFSHTVAEIDPSLFDDIESGNARAKQLAEGFIALYERETGKAFPVDPRDALHECVNAVFDSWDNERAIVYRRAHGLTHLPGTAVNVQTMFDSEISGIAFTADPSAPDRNEIIIESSYGLGESIVSGNVTPDRFVLDAESLSIKERDIGRKAEVMAGLSGAALDGFDPDAPSLTDDQISELAILAQKVERYFGFPVDIEWGVKEGHFTLLQSRAVRGLDVARDIEVGRREEVSRLRNLVPKGGKVWIVHNLAETLRAPTPLTWDIIREFMSGDGGYGMMYRDFGYNPSDETRRQGFLELICGRIYTDPDRAAGFYWKGMPYTYDHGAILDDPGVLESAPTTFDPERADAGFLLRLPGTLLAMLKNARITKKARSGARDHFDATLTPYLEYLSKQGEKDLSTATTQEVCDEIAARIQRVMSDFGKESLKPGFFGGCARAELEMKLVQLMGARSGTGLCQTLTSGLEGDSSVEQEELLCQVSDGKRTLQEFLEQYGHRTTDEMELATPRWREDPSYLEDLIRTASPSESSTPETSSSDMHHALKKDERVIAMDELSTTLEEWGGSFMCDELEALARESQELLPYRETGKHYLMMGYELIRQAVLELGRRWDIGGDVFFLHLHELEHFEADRNDLEREIEKRRVRWQSQKRLDLPDLIDSTEIDRLGLPREIEASTRLNGKPLSGGVAEGTARIVSSPSEAVNVHGSILVCPSTDPSWTSLFTRISGLVVERGGVLSHGAITARDFGIPAVACPDATRIINDGARIRVDGDSGYVSVLDEDE